MSSPCSQLLSCSHLLPTEELESTDHGTGVVTTDAGRVAETEAVASTDDVATAPPDPEAPPPDPADTIIASTTATTAPSTAHGAQREADLSGTFTNDSLQLQH